MSDMSPPTRPVPRWLLVFLIRHTVAYHLAELMARRLEFHSDVDPPLAVVVAMEGRLASRDDLEERVTTLEQRLLQVEASLGGQGMPAHPPVADSLARIADALAAGKTEIASTAREAKKLECVASCSSGRTGELPAEVSTAQAAEMLGVSKDTVLVYRERGLLSFRDIAPPGSTKPIYMFPREAVIKLRTTYQTEQPAPAMPTDPPRRPVKGQRKYKHLDLD